MPPVSGGRSAPSDGHGVDRNFRKPKTSVLSSLSSLVNTTTKASTGVMACLVRACVNALYAHVAEEEAIMHDFLLDNSHVRKTPKMGGPATSGSYQKPGTTTSSSESGSQPPHAHDLPECGRARVADAMQSPSSSEFGPTTQHAVTPHAITATPRVGARRGRQRMFWGNWARPSSQSARSVHTVQAETTSTSMSKESGAYLPELGRARVVNTMQSLDASEIGPTVQSVNDESSLSDTSSGSVAYRDDHAPTSADTQYFNMGSGGEIFHTPCEVSLGFNVFACQVHTRQMEIERDLLVGKLASEAHAADERLKGLRHLNDGLV